MKRIHLISGPRNISTALMYAFGNRPDTEIVDEPLYACYLSRTNIDHPGKREIIASQDTLAENVLRNIFFGPLHKKILFIKTMVHHLFDLDTIFMNKLDNIFLIRHPAPLIHSYSQVIPSPCMRDIGLDIEKKLFDQVRAGHGRALVLDAHELLKNPRKVLDELCTSLDIPFSEFMLHWPKGPRAEDGVWARYWYRTVHDSTGFGSPKEYDISTFPEYLVPLLDEALPLYDYLYQFAIKA